MKKKYILYGIAAVVVIAVIIVCIWYFSPKTFLKNVDASDVSAISVFNGSTGKSFTIENTDEIKYIVENIQSIEMKRDNISSNYDGFSFSLTFKDADGKTLDSFIVNSDDTIRDDPFFYRCDGGLCFEYLKSLEEYYKPNEEKAVRVYMFRASEKLMKPSFTLHENGTFQMTFAVESSYIGIGTYTLVDGRLTLKTDDGNYTYCFDSVGNTYVFDAEASSDMVWFSDMTDGCVFE